MVGYIVALLLGYGISVAWRVGSTFVLGSVAAEVSFQLLYSYRGALSANIVKRFLCRFPFCVNQVEVWWQGSSSVIVLMALTAREFWRVNRCVQSILAFAGAWDAFGVVVTMTNCTMLACLRFSS